MSTHQAAFEAIGALIAADVGATGLTNPASVSNLFGGLLRRGDPQRAISPPWIEFEVAGEREQDAMSRDRVDLVLRLHLFTKRDAMYTSAAGNQNSIATRMRAVFHMVTPAAGVQGWNPNQMYRTSAQQLPDDGNHAHYVETYLLRMTAA